MALEKVVKQGRLADIFPLFDRSTIQHAYEIQKDRAVNQDLRVGFWTADFPMYVMDGKEAVLYMGRNKDNLVFDNITEATKQLREKNNYFINDRKNIDSVINSDTTLKVVLSDLKLKGDDSEWKYFEINTASKTDDKKNNYDSLNSAQRALAERVHGKGQAFVKTMEMLNDAGITITKVYILNPEYVKKNVLENGAIARGGFLDSFVSNSNFLALYRYVDSNFGRLRGVLLFSGVGAPKIVSPTYYDISQVLTDGSRESSFAPDQIKILRNIMEQNNYKIIKGE
jgi:hypothetical protein